MSRDPWAEVTFVPEPDYIPDLDALVTRGAGVTKADRDQDREYIANGGDNEAVAWKYQRRRDEPLAHRLSRLGLSGHVKVQRDTAEEDE